MNINNELFDFIKNSPSAFHAIDTVINALSENGFNELCEGDKWSLSDGGKYFVKRNGTSLIAFTVRKNADGFMIVSSHSDAPAFRLKMTPEISGAYVRLEVERYGGMINYTWLDRPLSVAGRVVARTPLGLEIKLCKGLSRNG